MADPGAEPINAERERIRHEWRVGPARDPRRHGQCRRPGKRRDSKRAPQHDVHLSGANLHASRLNSTLPIVPDNRPARRDLLAVALVSAALLTTELALTRIFSVVMYYHFAFLAISIALFGLSGSGVFAYVARTRLDRHPTATLLARQSIVYGLATIVALFVLVRMRVGLNYSPRNLELMVTIYAVAVLPFFAGGLILTLAIWRLGSQINAVYAADLTGAASGCLVLIPLLDW